MNLSRKWLNEFVQIDVNDKEFAEAMTLSGSKVEVTEVLGEEISLGEPEILEWIGSYLQEQYDGLY